MDENFVLMEFREMVAINRDTCVVLSVVMTIERARLAMQLASQVRTKAVEAYTDIFHTQV